MRQVLITAAMLVGFGAAAQAAAPSYNAVTDFNTPGSPWSYGSGGVGGAFVAFTGFATDGCAGTTGLSCFNTPDALYTLPAIGINISASDPLVFYSNTLTYDQLFVQPAPGAPAILRFTAPTAGSYIFNALFTRIDTMDGAGNGVMAGVYSEAIGSISDDLTTVFGSSFAYNERTVMAAGEYIDFFVDAKGNFNNDGTGLAITVQGVPEPATWALMIGGFGLTGAALRRRRTGFASA